MRDKEKMTGFLLVFLYYLGYYFRRMKKTKHIFYELILIISGVFIFRGLWTLMDRVEIFNHSYMHFALLILGITGSIYAVDKLTHKK